MTTEEERILSYLAKDEYPKSFKEKAEKRKLRSKAKSYKVKNGKLLWINRKGEEREVICLKNQRDSLLRHFHDKGGHLGIEKTYAKLAAVYYWKNLYRDVTKYISSCVKCQKAAVKVDKEEDAKLHPIPVISPWYHVGMDLVTMPRSKSGNSYILSIVDYFTKWPECIAIPDKSASTVAQALYEVCLRLGFPSVYSSDQGREFVNVVVSDLVRIAGASHRISTAYHPQTNGLVERFNQTIQRMILKVCNQRQDDWDIYLQELLFAYRTSPQKSSKQTPFEVMYGRKAVSSLTGEINDIIQCVNSEDDMNRCVEHLADVREKLNERSKSNIQLAQAEQCSQFKKRRTHSSLPFEVGEKVLVFNARKASRKGSKLQQTWLGPYIIKELTDHGVAVLKTLAGDAVGQKYNVKLMKRFIERSVQEYTEHDVAKQENTSNSQEAVDCDDQASDMEELSDTGTVKSNETYFNPVDHKWQVEKAKILSGRKWSGKKHPNYVCLPVLKEPSKTEPMRGDGNCFFRGISYALFGLQKYHRSVRNTIVKWMEEHNDQIKNYFGENYLENSEMGSDGKWATEVEILSTAAILNTNIQIWCKAGAEMKWLCYKSEILGKSSGTEKCIYLCNNSGVHFDYVVYAGH